MTWRTNGGGARHACREFDTYTSFTLFYKKFDTLGWGVYYYPMDKRYDNTRPLCVADDNTCPNVAGMKERKRDGTWRYHTLCDSHRRHGHSDMVVARTKKSRRYIPLDSCAMCNDPAEERHRVLKGATYDKYNVLTLCKGCHKKIHKLYHELKALGFVIIKP